MPDGALKVVRDWRKLAEQASREQDPAKLKDLVSELCDLLEKQIQRHKS